MSSVPGSISRSPRRRLLRAVVLTSVALVASVAYVWWEGITIDLSERATALAAQLSVATGRDIRVEGGATLRISGHPRLQIRGVVFTGGAGFDADPLVRLGEARLAIRLSRLVTGRIFVEELTGSDLQVFLHQRANGTNNWTFATGAPEPAPQNDSGPAASDVLRSLGIGLISIERVAVHYRGPGGSEHRVDLDSLVFRETAGGTITLSARGRVEDSFPYTVDLAGGPLRSLFRGSAPWPFEATLGFLGTTLTVSGEAGGAEGSVVFGLGAPEHTELERLLRARLPAVGPVGVAGEVVYTPGKFAVSGVRASMGASTAVGELEFAHSGDRTLLRGHLALPALDISPFLQRASATPQRAPKSLTEVYRELARSSISLAALSALDLDLRLEVRRWLNLPGDIRNTRVEIRARDGRVRIPVSTHIAGVPFLGEASVEPDAQREPVFRFALDASPDADLGGLGELFAGTPGISGRMGRFAVRIAARGDTGAELAQSLDLRVELDHARLHYGSADSGRPVGFRLDRLRLAWPAGRPLEGRAEGSLLDKPVEWTLRGAPLVKLLSEGATPVDFDFRAGSARARLHGAFREPTAGEGSVLAFELDAPRAGDLERWIGLAPRADAPLALTGTLRTHRDGWDVPDLALRLGRSEVRGMFARTALGLSRLQFVADVIDVAELESLLPQRPPAPRKDAVPGAVLDLPVLPSGVHFADADFDLRVQRFLGVPVELRDMAFSGRMREGALQASTIRATIAGIALEGALAIDLRNAEPAVSLWLAADQFDAGPLLRDLHLAQNVDAQIGAMRVHIEARAARLGDFLQRSEFSAEFEGGRVRIRNPGAQRTDGRGEIDIALDRGVFGAAPGKAMGLSLMGRIDTIPVALAFETGTARELADTRLPVPFRLIGAAAQSSIHLSGRLARPFGKGEARLALEATGPRLDAFDPLVRTALPPWGPWSATGEFSISQRGYAVEKLELQVGTSTLTGHGTLDLSRSLPRLDVSLNAPAIQLDDFPLGTWSPAGERNPTVREGTAQAAAPDTATRINHLLSRQSLARQEVVLDARVERVLSGQDMLGNGSLTARLEGGEASLRFAVQLPGGAAQFALQYVPGDRDAHMNMALDIDRLDYGVLARRIKPDSDQKGVATLKADLSSRAEHPSEILRHGSGRIDLALWPQDLKAGVFDFWAINLLEALVPFMDQSSASRVNCAIGRFVLEDGKLVERTVVVDTNRIRVHGRGNADFARETLHFRFDPRPKRAEFLSLATPVEARGTFSDYSIGVSAADVLGSLGRFATSIFTVPVERLVEKPLPEDGADVCADPEVGASRLPQ